MYRKITTALILVVVFLAVFGIIMLYSTSYAAYGQELIKRQLVWLGLGGVAAFILRWIDYRFFARYAPLLLVLVMSALFYLALMNVCYSFDVLPKNWFQYFPLVGDSPTKGSYRWLRLGIVAVQPSVFFKIVVILFLADYWNRHARHILEFWRGFMKPLGVAGIGVGLILAGDDFSTAAITGVVVFTLGFIAGVRIRYLILVLCGGMLLAAAVVLHSPERMSRVTNFQNPQLHKDEGGYQLWASMLALGSGGWTGMGFTDSRMKQHYLPEAPTDFIVAVVGEELGFIGVMALLASYVSIIIIAFRIATIAVDRTGMFIAIGVAISIVLHAFVNLAVVSGFVPTTGITAPFLSYGGSSLVTSFIGIGLLLSVIRIAEKQILEQEMASAVQPTQPIVSPRTQGTQKNKSEYDSENS